MSHLSHRPVPTVTRARADEPDFREGDFMVTELPLAQIRLEDRGSYQHPQEVWDWIIRQYGWMDLRTIREKVKSVTGYGDLASDSVFSNMVTLAEYEAYNPSHSIFPSWDLCWCGKIATYWRHAEEESAPWQNPETGEARSYVCWQHVTETYAELYPLLHSTKLVTDLHKSVTLHWISDDEDSEGAETFDLLDDDSRGDFGQLLHNLVHDSVTETVYLRWTDPDDGDTICVYVKHNYEVF